MPDSYSLKFCREAASDQERSGLADRDWSKAFEDSPAECIKNFMSFNILKHDWTLTNADKSVRFHIKAKYEPDADFQYFTYSSSIHDGTLLFYIENMCECLAHIYEGKTYYTKISLPENGDTIIYTIGNFVILNENNGDYVPPNKRWMCDRTTVLLPIRIDLIKK